MMMMMMMMETWRVLAMRAYIVSQCHLELSVEKNAPRLVVCLSRCIASYVVRAGVHYRLY
jgi:hypothetical protein